MKTYNEFLVEGVDPDVAKIKKGQTIKFYYKDGTDRLITAKVATVGKDFFILRVAPTGDVIHVKKDNVELDK